MNECEQKGIPKHLHRNDREVIADLQLASDDKVCIRVKSSDWDESTDRPALNAFVTSGQSCNLLSLGQVHEDVLYDLNCPTPNGYRYDWRIVSMEYGILSAEEFSVNGEAHRVFIPFLKHDPTDCNFPHCEIWFQVRNGLDSAPVLVREIKPTSVKMAIRQFYRDRCEIHKRPDAQLGEM